MVFIEIIKMYDLSTMMTSMLITSGFYKYLDVLKFQIIMVKKVNCIIFLKNVTNLTYIIFSLGVDSLVGVQQIKFYFNFILYK